MVAAIRRTKFVASGHFLDPGLVIGLRPRSPIHEDMLWSVPAPCGSSVGFRPVLAGRGRHGRRRRAPGGGAAHRGSAATAGGERCRADHKCRRSERDAHRRWCSAHKQPGAIAGLGDGDCADMGGPGSFGGDQQASPDRRGMAQIPPPPSSWVGIHLDGRRSVCTNLPRFAQSRQP